MTRRPRTWEDRIAAANQARTEATKAENSRKTKTPPPAPATGKGTPK